jgi:hypothetical protein
MSLKDSKSSFRDWIGLRRNLEFGNAQWLGTIIGGLIALIAMAVAIGSIATLIQFLAVVLQEGADHAAIRNIGLIVVVAFGAPFVIWRAIVAQQQADTAKQSHITDQINNAVAGLGANQLTNKIGRPVEIFMGKSTRVRHVDANPDTIVLGPKSLEIMRYEDTWYDEKDEDVVSGLHIKVQTWENERPEIEWQSNPFVIEDEAAIAEVGDWSVFSESLPNIEVRVSAIYALERIAQDSLRDHIQIMEILTAYIRENAPVHDLEPSEDPFHRARPRTDVQAALDVIGRRSPILVSLEHSRKYRLDLREVDLSGANFSRGDFEGALLFGSRFEATNFRSANLRASRMQDCLLNFAVFFDANLCGAIIGRAKISSFDAMNASITMAADIRGISMAGSDISAISHFSNKKTHRPTFGTKDTKLHHFLLEEHDERASDIDDFMSHSNGIEIEDEGGVRSRLMDSGFLYWSPFAASDGMTGPMRAKLWSDIGLNGFPFDD